MHREIRIGLIAGVIILAVVIVFWSQMSDDASVDVSPTGYDHFDFATAEIVDPGDISSRPTPVRAGVRPGAERIAALPKSEQRTHTFVKGDTLWGLARKYYGEGSKWRLIRDANQSRIPKSKNIRPGARLVIPGVPAAGALPARAGSRIHVVSAGDSLSGISQKYYGSVRRWKSILRANRNIITSPTRLRVGMALVIPPAS